MATGAGSPDLEIVDEAAIRRLEPLARGRWALYSPHTGIISPYELTIALAECAWQNGAEVRLEAPVEAVELVRRTIRPHDAERRVLRPARRQQRRALFRRRGRASPGSTTTGSFLIVENISSPTRTAASASGCRSIPCRPGTTRDSASISRRRSKGTSSSGRARSRSRTRRGAASTREVMRQAQGRGGTPHARARLGLVHP